MAGGPEELKQVPVMIEAGFSGLAMHLNSLFIERSSNSQSHVSIFFGTKEESLTAMVTNGQMTVQTSVMDSNGRQAIAFQKVDGTIATDLNQVGTPKELIDQASGLIKQYQASMIRIRGNPHFDQNSYCELKAGIVTVEPDLVNAKVTFEPQPDHGSVTTFNGQKGKVLLTTSYRAGLKEVQLSTETPQQPDGTYGTYQEVSATSGVTSARGQATTFERYHQAAQLGRTYRGIERDFCNSF